MIGFLRHAPSRRWGTVDFLIVAYKPRYQTRLLSPGDRITIRGGSLELAGTVQCNGLGAFSDWQLAAPDGRKYPLYLYVDKHVAFTEPAAVPR